MSDNIEKLPIWAVWDGYALLSGGNGEYYYRSYNEYAAGQLCDLLNRYGFDPDEEVIK